MGIVTLPARDMWMIRAAHIYVSVVAPGVNALLSGIAGNVIDEWSYTARLDDPFRPIAESAPAVMEQLRETTALEDTVLNSGDTQRSTWKIPLIIC